MSDDAANAEVERDRTADALRPQRVEPASAVGEVPSSKAQPHAADGGPSAVRRRWKRILIALGAAMVLGLAVAKLLDRQPRYQGRTAESWLALVSDSRHSLEARNALAAMGRNAVPYEIKVLGRHDSRWRRMLRGVRAKAPAFVAGILPDSQDPASMRTDAKLALLTNPYTGEFMPHIVRLLDDSDPHVRVLALGIVYNLPKCLDRSAIPAICRALKDPDPGIRRVAASTLGLMGAVAQDAVPDLERALEDTNSQVRLEIVRALSGIGGTNLTDERVLELLNEVQFWPVQGETSNVPNR